MQGPGSHLVRPASASPAATRGRLHGPRHFRMDHPVHRHRIRPLNDQRSSNRPDDRDEQRQHDPDRDHAYCLARCRHDVARRNVGNEPQYLAIRPRRPGASSERRRERSRYQAQRRALSTISQIVSSDIKRSSPRLANRTPSIFALVASCREVPRSTATERIASTKS
jgi:hypothetical protein